MRTLYTIRARVVYLWSFVSCVLGYTKIWIRSPNTGEVNTRTFKSGARLTKEETKNPLKTAHASKVLNPLTRALAPPFIERRRDFYIPKVPSNLRNIPNVNMYTNVLYILWFAGLTSYIYKPATSSHIKPGLLRRRLWLGFLLIHESLSHGNLHAP
jgi:hypothetical protein